MKKVCVVGLGYIGLPTALVAAQHNLQVVGYDIDHRRVEGINNNMPLIDEPELKQVLAAVNMLDTFYATTTPEAADFFIIAVPTPCTDDKKADLSYVHHAVATILPYLTYGNTIILESTIPVGTTVRLAREVEAATGMLCGTDFYFAHCPERVLPGKIFHELLHNERIIGGVTEQCAQKARSFYAYFVQAEMHNTDANTAEMVKLVENSSRDVAIAFAHQVAQMAEKQGIEPRTVIEFANKHPRVSILTPSCGVGGHCIALDPWFLIETFPEETALLQTARAVNDARPEAIITKITAAALKWKEHHKKDPCIVLLGATYKPNVDDLRESPALHIAHALTKTFSTTYVCEPHVSDDTLIHTYHVNAISKHAGIVQGDIIVGLVKHATFGSIQPTDLAGKEVYDFCGIWYNGQKHHYHATPVQTASNHSITEELMS